MKRLLRTMAGVAMLLVLTVGPSAAVGPNDGIWTVTQSNIINGITSYFVSLHQNGSSVVLIEVNNDGTWQFAIGTVDGDHISGTLYDSAGATFGTFTMTFSGNSLSGGLLGPGVFFTLTGSRIF